MRADRVGHVDGRQRLVLIIGRQVLKRFHLVKEWKTKTGIDGRDIEIKLRMVLWSGGDMPGLLSGIQQEIRDRLKKILGPECRLEIFCDVVRIEESNFEVEENAVSV